MEEKRYYLSVDIGASSGRHILGWMENGKIRMEEIYRFQNGLEKRNGHLCWNLDRLFDEVVAGLKECKRLERIPTSVGIDTWGVDFVLLDAQGNMLGSPVAYRDGRTKGMDDVVYRTISETELYSRNGIQKQIFNTIYQLVAIRETEPELLERAERFLNKFAGHHWIIDAAELGLGELDESVAEYFNALVMHPISKQFITAMADVRMHPMSYRRYMWKFDY